MLTFAASVQSVNEYTLVKLPEAISKQLPSRGQVAVTGTLNDQPFKVVLEPDGNWGHWFKLDQAAGEHIHVAIEPTKAWPEPQIPDDFAAALQTAPANVQTLWPAITPMARWEWVRWINETSNPETRKRRVEVSISKMQNGKRRPCCFNLSACTDPTVSKSGRLLTTSA